MAFLDSPRLASHGILLLALCYAIFAVLDFVNGSPASGALLVAGSLGNGLAASGLRDFRRYPGETSVAWGFGMVATAGVGHVILGLVAGAGVFLVPVGLHAVASGAAAVGAIRWSRALDDEAERDMPLIRLGVGSVGVAFLAMVVFTFVFGAFRPLDILAFACGILGPLLFATGFVLGPTPATTAVTPAQPTRADAAP